MRYLPLPPVPPEIRGLHWAAGLLATAQTSPPSPSLPSVSAAARLTTAIEPPTCVPCSILCNGAHVTGSRPCKLRFDRNGPSSPPATSKPQPSPPAPPTGPIHKTAWSSRHLLCLPWCPVCQPPALRLLPASSGPRRPPPTPPHHRNLSAWTETVLADVHAATSTLPAAPYSTTAGSRKLHLWETYHAVHRRWPPRKHNRHLYLRLARLASDMEEHCSSLLRQEWGQTCDRMAGNLGLRDTWSLLRVLLDPTHTKASQRKDISHRLHSSPLTDTDFLAALRDRYLCTEPPTSLPTYTGSLNPDLEADISLGEVRTEEDKVTSLIRQAYKSALSFPTSTSTARLLPIDVHNSLTELTEAHRTAELLRLSRTRPGRALLPTLTPITTPS
ncbi:hypothetical protein HPB49_025664 [Dermacentor silvarum]|nr:hypothetical protein HPB49_025664 [Dermacentor silvarum]